MPHLRARLAALPLTLALVGALSLAAPAPALATRLDTDLICGTAANATGYNDADRPDIEARNAIVVGKDGTVYFARDADAEVKIASVTKVMTAIVALEHAQLTDTVTVDNAAANVGESSADLKEGDTMPLSTALKALMLPSGNDAAMAIATSVGALMDPSSANPYQVFVDAMNAKAKELGMAHSVFTNPHGLDFGAWEGDLHSTARDVATMFAHAMKKEEFRQVVADPSTKITVRGADGADREIELTQHNKILGTHGNIGGKTGGTDQALQCFVGAFSRELGGEAYVVTLGSDGDAQRFKDNAALADWYYAHWVNYPVVTADKTTAAGGPLVARVGHEEWTDRTVDVTVGADDAKKTVALFSLAGEVKERVSLDPVAGAVSTGDELGSLALAQAGRELAQVTLVSAEDQAGPDPFQWVMVGFDRLVRFFTGQPLHAQVERLYRVPNPTDLDAAQ